MGSEQGRRVVWSLLEKGQVFGACFNVDPHITAFNEGQRNLALVLFQRVMRINYEVGANGEGTGKLIYTDQPQAWMKYIARVTDVNMVRISAA